MGDHVLEASLEQAVEPLSAGVHDARLAQDRQQRRRLRHGSLSARDGGGQHVFEVAIRLGNRHGRRRGLADHGENRSFDGLGDGLVSSGRALAQRVRKIESREVMLSAQALGHATEDLRGDDTRVAASAHQRPEADGLRDAVGGRIRDCFCFGQGSLDGGEHVATRVAVGDRVHV